MRAQHTRRTAAPAPARMNILPFGKDFASAVKQLALVHVDFLFAQQLNEKLSTQAPQIARHHQIVIRKAAPQIPEMRRKCIESRWRHGRSHVVRIRNAQIHHAPACRMRQDHRRVLRTGNHHRARAGHRPLRRRRALIAQFRRRAILPLRRAEVAARRADQPIRKASVRQHAADGQGFRHGGTRPVQTVKRDSEVTRRKSGGNDLVEQIAREQHLNFVQPRSRFFRAEHNRLFEHRAFSAFKGLLPVQLVRYNPIEFRAIRAFFFLLPRNPRPADQAGARRQRRRLRTDSFAHPPTSADPEAAQRAFCFLFMRTPPLDLPLF